MDAATSSPQRLSLRAALPLWWTVAHQWFTGSCRWQARGYVLLCAGLALCTTLLSVRVSYAQKHFSTGLAEKNKVAWMAAVWEFVGIICIAAPIKALDFYTEKRLVAEWRASLTQAFITAYTSNKAYFHLQLAKATEGEAPEADPRTEAAAAHNTKPHKEPVKFAVAEGTTTVSSSSGSGTGSGTGQQSMTAGGAAAAAAAVSSSQVIATEGFSASSAQVDNPDQRITADVANFVSTSVSLVLLLAKKVLNCAAFAGVLWSISPKLVLFLLCYAVLGTAGTAALFGRPLTRLQQKILKLEADLRFGLVRLRENAEAIAFYGGEEREASDLSRRLAAMLAVLLHRIAWLGWYELWVIGYSYATILLPSLVLAPQYFAGSIPFGTLTQASYAFTVLEGALGLILAKIDEFSALAAETARLAGLLSALKVADREAGGNGIVQGFAPSNGKGKGKGPTSGGGYGVASGLRGLLGAAGRIFGLGKRRVKMFKSGGGSEARYQAVGEAGANADEDDGEWEEETEEDVELAKLVQARTASSTSASTDVAADFSGLDGSGSSSVGKGLGNGAAASSNALERVVGVPRVLRLMDGSTSGFSVEGLSACVPGMHHSRMVVCQHLSFSLQPGESLLVMGPSGCGKSSLLRIIAGLWTIGGGTIRGPHPQQIFFLPQKPFMPLGSLRQQLMFPSGWTHESPTEAHSSTTSSTSSATQVPHDASTADSNTSTVEPASSSHHSWCLAIDGISGHTVVDSTLKKLLETVNLGHLLTRFSAGLDAVVDWAAVLSLGEQQRVALLRLLFHGPQLAFLDEATAALDPASEALVYSLLRQACSSYVSVGHRRQLLDWHSHVLVADVRSGGAHAGSWNMYPVQEYKQRLAAGLEG